MNRRLLEWHVVRERSGWDRGHGLWIDGAPGGHALPNETDPVVGRDLRARRRSTIHVTSPTLYRGRSRPTSAMFLYLGAIVD